MTKKKPLVVVTRRLPELVETRMRELFDARLNIEDKPMSQAEIVEAMREADVLVPTLTDQINAAMIAQAGDQMRLIANFGNGVDHIDVTSALRRGITVTNTPGVLTEDTADIDDGPDPLDGAAAGGGLARHSRRAMDRLVADLDAGRRITGKRLGIVGMGRIGQALARRARAFGMSIHYHNRRRVAAQVEERSRRPIGIRSTRCWREWIRLDQLPPYARHLPPSVRPPAEISPPRRHSHQYRARRGGRRECAHPDAGGGELANAGLDVFEHAPAVNEKLIALAKMGKVTLLPHMGSATHEGRADVGEKVIINIRTFVDGHRPPDRVLPSML